MSASDYRMSHRPARPGTGAPAHDLESVMPDFYSRPKLYDFGEPGIDESIRQLQRARGNPDAEVNVYRAMPREAGSTINTGDWVTTSASYAKQHAMQDDDPEHDWPVHTAKARAGDLWTQGDSVNEFGYHGPPVKGKRVR